MGAHLVGRVGGRVVAAAGLLLTAVGSAVLAQAPTVDDALGGVMPGFLMAAFGIGPVFVAATTTALANVPREDAGVASAVVNTFHELGGSIGVAVVSTIAAASFSTTGITDTVGFSNGYLACAVIAGATALIAAALVPCGKPQAVVGHGHGMGHGH